MPPEDEKPRPTREEIAVLEQWIKAGAPAVPQPAGPPPPLALSPAVLAAQVKAIFRSRCLECHGGSKTRAGVKILDHDLLVHRKNKVVPGKPDASPAVPAHHGRRRFGHAADRAAAPQRRPMSMPFVSGSSPGRRPFRPIVSRPAEKDKDKALKDVVGVDYVLKKILEHARSQPVADRRFLRYFSINHLLTGGASRAELDLERDALAKAINHLTWEPRVVPLTAIDEPANTLFVVDLRQLGWNKQPFDIVRQGKAVGRGTLNLFDLVLLEYPYGVIYEDSETFDRLTEEFLQPSGMVRPIPYIRADWFVSVATQPPLYEDLLRLPFDLSELESLLGVDSATNVQDSVARRAGMAVSGVSRNNRVVERHPLRTGAYWKSFDFRSSKGRANIFTDPIHLAARPAAR